METQWIIVGLGVIGFLLTWTGMVVSVTRAVSAIKTDTSVAVTTIKEDTAKEVASETSKITARLNEMIDRFEEDQRSQDNRFGEVALSIRQYVANVEKEMHQIEIWGRDNFVLKSDFFKALDRVEDAINRMGTNIREELKSLREEIKDTKKEHDS